MEVKVLSRKAWKTSLPFSFQRFPHCSLVMSTQGRVKREEGSKLPLTLLMHREPPPELFIPLILSPSEHLRFHPGRLVWQSGMEPNPTALKNSGAL